MATLNQTLSLDRCPHCSIDKPNLVALVPQIMTQADNFTFTRYWKIYGCQRCGGVVTAYSQSTNNGPVEDWYPRSVSVAAELPTRVKHFLQEAVNSISAPSGCIMLCASAVDEMLKQLDYKTGTLYTRIDQAKNKNLFTADMATWAHKVRLDANDQRHADEGAALPNAEDAKQAIQFTVTLGELLFVLPDRIKKNIRLAK